MKKNSPSFTVKMKSEFLLDTNILLWAVAERTRLRPHVLKLLENETESLWISAVSSCEIAIKWAAGKIDLPAAPLDFINAATQAIGCSQLSINSVHGAGLANLPLHHRDPWDRLLIVQAQTAGLKIVTSDKEFTNYDVEIVLN